MLVTPLTILDITFFFDVAFDNVNIVSDFSGLNLLYHKFLRNIIMKLKNIIVSIKSIDWTCKWNWDLHVMWKWHRVGSLGREPFHVMIWNLDSEIS